MNLLLQNSLDTLLATTDPHSAPQWFLSQTYGEKENEDRLNDTFISTGAHRSLIVIMVFALQTIKSKDAWNTPQNSTDFPYCVFEIRCLEEMEQPFLCEITATHEKDSTKVVVVAPLEQVGS